MAKPIKKFKAGMYEVAIWENERESSGKKFTATSVSLQKSWPKQDSQEFERATISNISTNDIPKIVGALWKAYEDQCVKAE